MNTSNIKKNSFYVLIILIISFAFLLTPCSPISRKSQLENLVSSIDWSNDWSVGKFNRIRDLTSSQEGQEEFYELLNSDDDFTVVNTAVLINILEDSGSLQNAPKQATISALTRVISGSNSEYKPNAIVALNNTANDYIISLSEDRILEERLSDLEFGLITQIINALITTLNDDNDQVKYFAAQSLHKFSSRAIHAEPVLATLLESESVDVRLSAAAAIGHINPNTQVDVIPVILDGLVALNRGSIPIIAVKALVKIGESNQEVINTLLELLKSENNVLRETVVSALIDLRPEADDIIPKLKVLLNNENEEIRDAANRILLEYENEVQLNETND